jgi:hypothetical protein
MLVFVDWKLFKHSEINSKTTLFTTRIEEQCVRKKLHGGEDQRPVQRPVGYRQRGLGKLHCPTRPIASVSLLNATY